MPLKKQEHNISEKKAGWAQAQMPRKQTTDDTDVLRCQRSTSGPMNKSFHGDNYYVTRQAK